MVSHHERTYWPFDALPHDERTPLHEAMIRFFKETFNAGFKPYSANHFSEIGFDSIQGNIVRYVARGGRGHHWEPWLSENGRAVFLGTLWNLTDSTCVVFDGFDDMTTFTMRWLTGDSLRVSLDGVPVYNKHRSDVPMFLPKHMDPSVGN